MDAKISCSIAAEPYLAVDQRTQHLGARELFRGTTGQVGIQDGDVVNRGVAVWQGKVYVGTLDGRLIALDANTGKELCSQDTFIDRSRS